MILSKIISPLVKIPINGTFQLVFRHQKPFSSLYKLHGVDMKISNEDIKFLNLRWTGYGLVSVGVANSSKNTCNKEKKAST